MNSYDFGARALVSTIDAPKEAGWYAAIVGVASAGDRIVALVRADGREWVLRATNGGSAEVVEVPSGGSYAASMAIGAHAGDPVAWLDATTLFAMPASGGAATAIASFGGPDRATIDLGTPSKAGVPIYVAGGDWAAFRVFSTSATTKRKATSDAVMAVPAVLDGWIEAPVARSEAQLAPACDTKSRGPDFRFTDLTLPLEVDGTQEAAGYGGVTLRLGANTMCVAALSEITYASGALLIPAAKGHTGPVNFIRADLVSKRAEGGDAGTQPHSRSLSCKLEPN